MTALPDPNEFITTMGVNTESGVQLHPEIHDRYWGYEVRTTQITDRAAKRIRVAASIFALTLMFLGLTEVASPLVGLEIGSSPYGLISSVALTLAVLVTYWGSLHRPVRVQVDTATGELREVTKGWFGAEVILARYGMDAIAAVDVVASKKSPSLGQVHVRLNGNGVIPVGDGAVSALRPLRDRLAAECGLDDINSRPAIWTGPISA